MKNQFLSLAVLLFLSYGLHTSYAQEKRTLPKRVKLPKKKSKIKNVDDFVYLSFNLYKTLRRYDSLQIIGAKIPDELNKLVVTNVRTETERLYNLAPDMIEELTGKLSLKSVRATKNLLTTKKALSYMYKTMQYYIKENPDMLISPE